MRAPCATDLPLDYSADQAFQAALGVAQNRKNFELLAVHNEGRKLVAFEKAKMTNQRLHMLAVVEDDLTLLRHAVGTDPRQPKAVLDGKFNKRSATQFLEAVMGVLEGTEQAPVTPVENHYVQKKERVPWTDPDGEPDIELRRSWAEFLT